MFSRQLVAVAVCMQAAAVSCNYQLSRDNIHNEASNLQHFQNYEMLDITSPLVNGGPWLGGSSSHAFLHFIMQQYIGNVADKSKTKK